MTRDWRLPICAVVSIAGHLAFAHSLRRLPRHDDVPTKRVVSIRVIAPPPPSPEPPPEPTRPPDVAPKVPHERPRARPAPTTETPPKEVAAPEHPPPSADSTTPVFGISMESTSQAASGPAVPIGSTPRPSPRPRDLGEAARPLVAPVPAYQVTSMPLPQGRCQGRYTEEAKSAGIEGTVVLDLIVDELGRVRDVQVVTGLDHGLTQAAITAVKSCRFSPGEKDGTPVPVRVRGFKIRFLMQDEQ